MSSKKKRPGATAPPASPLKTGTLLKRFALPVFWVLVVVTVLWALMHYSTPQSNLETYTKFKETATPAQEETQPAPVDLEKISAEKDRGITELAQKAAQMQLPPENKLPRQTLEHIAAGMRLVEAGKFNQGNKEFEQASEFSPDSPEVFSIWGAALRMQKRYKGANKRFAKALKLAPDDPEIAFNWGMSKMEEKDSDGAIELLTKTIELQPDNHLAYNYLGKSYGQKKMYAEETESYRKVVELKPDFGWGHFNLGIVLSLQKKFQEAAPHFERAIEIDKQFEKPFVMQFLTAMGRSPTAKKQEDNKKEPPEPGKTAKADVGQDSMELSSEGKKSEGSDHDMEGSKNKRPFTNLSGKFLINGEPPSPQAIVILETKNKLKAPGQKVQKLTISQSDLQFVPKHSVIEVGSTVTFFNNDMEVHNIYSKSANNQFNLGAMATGSSKAMKFTQPGPVVLRCNLHKDMIGTLFVVPNGYHTHPNAEGKYKFENVASSGYIFQVWAPHLAPTEIEANLKSADLKGVDQTMDVDVKSASRQGAIHDLLDPINYNNIVDNIEKEMNQAIEDWAAGKKFISRKRMLMAITKHYNGEGLKGALAKSFSEKRSQSLEDKLDSVRKQISGIGTDGKDITEASLKNEAKFAVSQLRNNVRELEARLNPDPVDLSKK